MKVTIEVTLEGNLKLPTTAKCDTLSDLAKLGQKITQTARSAPRVFPALKDVPVKSVQVSKE